MVFDPFGDYDARGYLRNHVAEKDQARISRLEQHAFAANVLIALAALERLQRVDYTAVLDTHRILFGSVYPWAGQDRLATAPDIAIVKGGLVDLFAHPRDVERATSYALGMANDQAAMRTRPGEVFGALAHGHPFLDGNGRTLLVVHTDLARRAGFHIAWQDIDKPAFLAALTDELRHPGQAMDRLVGPHIRAGAMPVRETGRQLATNPGLGSNNAPHGPTSSPGPGG